ncbi:MAG: helix-turn-helix domain-containing protein [Clostridia bacterium]|nr:helix-turn-helix domain-containing protein [Clostridia bacterium]
MTNRILADNLKQYRLAKNMTQEQVASILLVNAQTVSRWECGTTLPDALTLPVLADLYGVTVDAFYRKYSVAYESYAERLSSVYEKTRDPEDFFRCMLEYQKQMRTKEPTPADQWNYAVIHHFMMRYCMDTALDWYKRAMSNDPQNDPHIYGRARSMHTKLLFEIGQGKDAITLQEKRLQENPSDCQEWCFLLEAYMLEKNYDTAYSCFLIAADRFPDRWEIFIHGGDICAALGKYEEAFVHYETAGNIGTYFFDELYAKADCYEKMGEFEKAANEYMNISEKHLKDGYDVEAEAVRELAKAAMKKTK